MRLRGVNPLTVKYAQAAEPIGWGMENYTNLSMFAYIETIEMDCVGWGFGRWQALCSILG